MSRKVEHGEALYMWSFMAYSTVIGSQHSCGLKMFEHCFSPITCSPKRMDGSV